MSNVFKLPSQLWARIGQLAIQLTRKDVRQSGIFQNNKKDNYRSQQYVKYKRNDMRKFGRGKKKVGKGERLKNYKGISISSRNTSFVNFTLTGQALNNMYSTTIDNGVVVSFASQDAGKVLGAEDNDRVLLTLRDQNITILEDEIVKQIDKNFGNLKNLKLTITL